MKFLSWSSWIFRRTVTRRSVPTNSTTGPLPGGVFRSALPILSLEKSPHIGCFVLSVMTKVRQIYWRQPTGKTDSHTNTHLCIYIYTRFYNELIKGLSSQPLTISPIAPKICHRWWPPAGSVAVPNRHRPAMPRASLETPRPWKQVTIGIRYIDVYSVYVHVCYVYLST